MSDQLPGPKSAGELLLEEIKSGQLPGETIKSPKRLRGAALKPGPGRAPGQPNKITRDVRAALQASFDGLGDQWFTQLAKKSPVVYANLLAKLIPNNTNVNVSGGVTYKAITVRVEDREAIPALPAAAAPIDSPAVLDAIYTDAAMQEEPDPFE